MPADPGTLLDENLRQLTRALSDQRASALPVVRAKRRGSRWAPAGLVGGLAALAAGIIGTRMGMDPAVVGALAGLGGLALAGTSVSVLLSRLRLRPKVDPTRPNIGMGVDMAADAIVEPGASVGSGVSVKARAIIRRGAVIRSGVDIGEGAVIEQNALVSWGVSIRAGAVVGAGAVIGTGCDVREGARVPAGMRLKPGTDWRLTTESTAALPPQDPRAAKVDAVCASLETELAQSPDAVKSFLTAPTQTISVLRQACHGLIAREQMLRSESSPEARAALEKEAAALKARAASAQDAQVKASLESAVAAIDEQGRQRESMARQAERIDAELTRLLWTLDGMNAQLVRLRGSGAQLATPDAEVARSLGQLTDELGAITGALHAVADEGNSFAEGAASPVSALPSTESGATLPAQRTKT